MYNDCSIRSLKQCDLNTVLTWRNHPNVRRFMLTQHEISMEEHQNWFERASLDALKRLFIIEDLSQPIGFVQFNNVMEGGIANWGFYACPKLPKGTGHKIGITSLCHAFEVLKLHKVCGQVLANNTKSITFHQRLGFQDEGILRDQQRVGTIYLNLHCFGLLSHEWISEKSNQEKSNASN